MTVKFIESAPYAGKWIMIASYWDGGYVLIDVTDPASPAVIGDTDFAAIDPELIEQTGIRLTPEGNAHQAEFTDDNRFFVGTDEDFGPNRARIVTDDGDVYDATCTCSTRPRWRISIRRPVGARGGDRSDGPEPRVPVVLRGWPTGDSDPVLESRRHEHLRARGGRGLPRPGEGNYFWGVEVIPNPDDDPNVEGGDVLILASDRDYGPFIFRDP